MEKKTVQASGLESDSAGKFIVSSSPHFLTKNSIPGIMHTVLMAMLPSLAASV